MMNIQKIQMQLNDSCPEHVGVDGYPFMPDALDGPIQRILETRAQSIHRATPWSDEDECAWWNALRAKGRLEDVWGACVDRLGWVVQNTCHRRDAHVHGWLGVLWDARLKSVRLDLEPLLVEHTLYMLSLSGWAHVEQDWPAWMQWCERYAQDQGLSPDACHWLGVLTDLAPWGREDVTGAMCCVRARRCLAHMHEPYVERGWHWTQRIEDDLQVMSPTQRAAWHAVFDAAQTVAARPSVRWRTLMARLIEVVGADTFARHMTCWLGLMPQGASDAFLDAGYKVHGAGAAPTPRSSALLRGLVCCVVDQPDELLCAMVTDVAIWAYKKVPQMGPLAPSVGRTCVEALRVHALGEAHLRRVLDHVEYHHARKACEDALNDQRLTQEVLEPRVHASLGMDAQGEWRARVGDYVATLSLTCDWGVKVRWQQWVERTGQAQLLFFGSTGSQPARVQKTAPKILRAQAPDLLEIIEHRRRHMAHLIDALARQMQRWMVQRRAWSQEGFLAQVSSHPILNLMAQSLVWQSGEQALWWTAQGWQTLEGVAHQAHAPVVLWHPCEADALSHQAWKRRVVQDAIVQPFAQVFRPVFESSQESVTAQWPVGHVVQQHQLLRRVRQLGGTYGLQGPWPASPMLTIPVHMHGQPYTIGCWVKAVDAVALKTKQGVPQYVEFVAAGLYEDESCARACAHDSSVPSALHSEAWLTLHEALVSCLTQSPEVLSQASQAKVTPAPDAYAQARKEWFEHAIEVHGWGALCAVQGMHLVLTHAQHPRRVCLRTGRCTDAQDDFAQALSERDRRRARHLIHEHMTWPHGDDPVTTQILSHTALCLWDVSQGGHKSSVAASEEVA